MEKAVLSGLQPEAVFSYFEQICAIPHGSGNTKAISKFLVNFAKKNGLRYEKDKLNNVIIYAPASAGYEDHPPVILQGHMDMVCEKDVDCPINMDKQGLDIAHDGEYVFAKGTTLGGDDGIAIAYALALLVDKDAVHPPLEVVITVDEETGMFGAAGINLSNVKGRTLINIDSEEEGIFTVSCAGGAKSTIRLPLKRHPVYGPCIELKVEGLQGGHSGVEIHKNRANANQIMGRFLQLIQEQMPVCLTGFSGGAKDNAIPRSCRATLVVLGLEPEKINAIAQQLQEQIRQEYDEPEAVVSGDNLEGLGGNALNAKDTAKVAELLLTVPNGVQAWSQDISGLVQTSLNMGVAQLNEKAMELTFAVRSSVNREKEELLEKLRKIAEDFGGEYSQMGEYPAWEYKKDSRLRDTMVQVYRKMYEKEPEVVAIHAGLECGLLGEKLPGLDCVSIGPDMCDIHTSREKLNIASTERTWRFLLEVLKNL